MSILTNQQLDLLSAWLKARVYAVAMTQVLREADREVVTARQARERAFTRQHEALNAELEARVAFERAVDQDTSAVLAPPLISPDP